MIFLFAKSTKFKWNPHTANKKNAAILFSQEGSISVYDS